MRRKPGALVPLELAICRTAADLRHDGGHEFHGYAIAKSLKEATEAKRLTAYGTLYRALGRLERMGLLESRWEDPAIAAQESRPGRRLYRLTAAGDEAIQRASRRELVPKLDPGMALTPMEVT